MNETQLIARVIAGDRLAGRTLYDTHAPRVYALSDEYLAVAIRSLGHNYVTGQDANLLRSLYPRLTGERSRDAVLASLSDLGGTENVQWLLGVVRDEKLTPEVRRRALEYLSRAGATDVLPESGAIS